MCRRLLPLALVAAGLLLVPAAHAATVDLTVDRGSGSGGPVPAKPARDGTPRWHVQHGNGVGLSATVRDDTGQVPAYGGRCTVHYQVLATGRTRTGDFCVMHEDGRLRASVPAVRQHVRAWVVVKADPQNEEFPIAVDTASATVELRAQAPAGIDAAYVAGRRLDGRLVVRFTGWVGSFAPLRTVRVALQRKAGRGWVDVARQRPRAGGRITFELIGPPRGTYRFLCLSPDTTRWDDGPSKPVAFRR